MEQRDKSQNRTQQRVEYNNINSNLVCEIDSFRSTSNIPTDDIFLENNKKMNKNKDMKNNRKQDPDSRRGEQ